MADTNQIDLTEPKKFPLTHKGLSRQRMADLWKAGKTYTEIAKEMDCHVSTVGYHITQWLGKSQRTKEFRENRAEIFASMQDRMLSSVSEDEIQKMAPDRRIWSAAVLYDKERLEEDKSTANVSYHIMGESLAELEQEKKKIEQQSQD